MRRLSSRAAVAVLVGACVLAVAAPWLADSRLAVALLTQMAWLSIVLLANNLLLGQCGLLSFGHAMQVGAGGLAGILVMRWGGLPLPLVPLAGGLAALLVALPLGFVATRSAGTAFAMVTLALGELAAGLALMLPELFGGEAGVSADRVYGRWLGLDFSAPIEVYSLAAAYALGCGWLLYALGGTALGKLWNAVRDNPARAAFLGHDPRRLRWLAYAAAGFFAGIGGALGALQFEIVSTADAVGLTRSGSYLLFTYLGGSAQFLGPVLGAVLMVLSTTLLAQWSAAWPLYLGLVFLLTVMFAPTGLAGLLVSAPAAARRAGPWRCLRAVAGTCLGAGGGIALVEMGYRLRWEAQAQPALAWAAAGLCLACGAALLTGWRR